MVREAVFDDMLIITDEISSREIGDARAYSLDNSVIISF